MNGQSQFGAMKFIALCLILVSFATLFFPWITISIDIMGMNLTLEECLEMGGMSKEDILDGMRDNLEYAYGTNANKLVDAMEILLEGEISVFQCATVLGDFSSMAKDLGAPKSTADELATYAAVAWGVIVVMGATAIYAIYSLVKDKKAGTLVYACISGVVLAAVAIAIGELNDAAGPAFQESLEDSIGGYVGMIDISSMISLELFHLGTAAFVCVGAAVLAAIFHKVHLSSVAKNATYAPTYNPAAPAYAPVAPGYAPAAPTYNPAAPTYTPAAPTYTPVAPTAPVAPVAPAAPVAGWTCSCGKVNNETNRFCNACGQMRPENSRCVCGAPKTPGQSFCSMCGTRFDAAPAPAPVEETTVICPQCGATQSKDHAFCKFCGTPMR